jgi:hypothetical protein
MRALFREHEERNAPAVRGKEATKVNFRYGLLLVVGCSSAASPSTGQPGSDAAVLDAAADAAQDLDAGGGDASCQPQSIAGFRPPAYLAPRLRSQACAGFGDAGGLIDSYEAACLGTSSTWASCAAFPAPDAGAAADCFSCLVTIATPDASSYGVIDVDPIPFVNYVACIASVDPTDAGTSCAKAASDAFNCTIYSCESVCPVKDDPSMAALNTCINAAASGPCAGYYLPAAACVAAEQGDGGTDVAKTCFAGADPGDHYAAAARYFCGGG